MYVDYYLLDGYKPLFHVYDYPGHVSHCYPSECCWMVPGTVDPMAD